MDSDLAVCEDELFRLSFERDTLMGMLHERKLERWVPGISYPNTEREHLARYEFVTAYTRGRHILDVACGAGGGSFYIADNGALSVTGVDIDEHVVRYASVRYRAKNLSFAVGDAQKELTGQFEVIVSFETAEHIPGFQAYLRCVKSVLVPNGIFIVSTPISKVYLDEKPANPYHVREWSLAAFRSEVSQVFEVKEVFYQLTKDPRRIGKTPGFVENAIFSERRLPGRGLFGRAYRGYQILVCEAAP